MTTATYNMTPDLREKYENMVRVLLGIDPEEFDFSVWGYLGLLSESATPANGGTCACIAGWCALDPWFRARGFSAGFDFDGFLEPNTAPSFPVMIDMFFEGDADLDTALPNGFMKAQYERLSCNTETLSIDCISQLFGTPQEIANALSSWIKEQETTDATPSPYSSFRPASPSA